MKIKKTIENTTNSRVYKLTRIPIISHCGWCAPHKGCNRRTRKIDNSWKNHRCNQWKDKD